MCNVTVLVPVYNTKPYLRECLDSLAAQTLEEIEFICIDDGSTDGCSEVLDEYADRDARFRVIHKENSGYGASMNVGLRAARGKYIGIVESDDFADSNMFKALYAVAAKTHADVVKSNFWQFKDGENTFVEALHGQTYGKPLCLRQEETQIFIESSTIWACIYRRKFLQEQDIWFNETPGASYQDTSFAFLTKAYADSFWLVREAYLHYRVDNASSSVYSSGKIFSVIDEYDAVQRHLEAHRLPEHEKLCGLSAQLLYLNFQFNESRIPLGMYPVFWEKGYPKLKAAQEQGVFYEDLGESMGAWMLHRYAFYQTAMLLREGFLPFCRAQEHVYLYGAGQVAKGLIEVLRQNGCDADGLLVTSKDENRADVDGVPVFALDASPADPAHDFVIIAVTPQKPGVQQEIFAALIRAGYRNVIVLTKELQQALARG